MSIDINGVKVWEQEIEIPTYEVGEPDKNPMFLEKRVYQGSSGKVYPLPVIDKIYDEKVNKKYKAVFLENEYLQIMILPELGGRIQRALDKTNNYDFVYHNRVVKPALVGLAGPWISGGIEFNWPQHHRPSTFMPVDYTLQENEDGSKTVWVSEIELMFRTKGMAGFTLHPGKAYLEIKAQLYNRTSVPQTFLWWANPAVAVNDHTQSVFPPDVHAVFDHGKRDVSKFPIATGIYYKMDYSKGVDISRYKNIPVPTSYMAYKSDYDFVGGYDNSVNAGILHVADHHVSPGKKQWTWGCGDFGQAWDRNLTDEDGPYIELMTGVFTDNQPDFTWLQPYEEKTFTQYFMPYKNVGVVKNATIDASVNLEVCDGKAKVSAYTTGEFNNAKIILKGIEETYIEEIVNLSPTNTYECEVKLITNELEENLSLFVLDCNGKTLVSYKPRAKKNEQIPEAAKAAPRPTEAKNNEELYLIGLHLEQYRHATYEPETYYEEGLKRDPEDIRINNAYGSLLFRRGLFKESEKYFRTAVKAITKRNPNPYDGEPLYNLGLSLKMQSRYSEAYDAFYKACWNAAMQDSGYYNLACIAAMQKDFKLALEHADKSIVRNYHNYKARNLKASLLRKLNKYSAAEKLAKETLEIDILDFASRNELYLIYKETNREKESNEIFAELNKLMRDNAHSYIEISLDYAQAGFLTEALDLLQRLIDTSSKYNLTPLVYYYAGYYCTLLNDTNNANIYYKMGAEASSNYCFPHRLDDILVLETVIANNPEDSKAYYYLGNLWYDKKQYNKAISNWEKSREIDESFPTVHRNLALAYYNKKSDAEKAKASLEKAFNLDKKDARVLLELDQLYRKLGIHYSERLKNLEENIDIVKLRDDLYIEYITLHNLSGNYEHARELVMNRKFHPWEGGEGKATSQYIYCHVEIAKKLVKEDKFKEAIEMLKAAMVYPHNLGEGKLLGAQENNINYYLGIAYSELGMEELSKEHFIKASIGLSEPSSAMYYNDQPPEMIFYQGMALKALGDTDGAKSRFNKLIDYGEKHILDNVTIDYFAVSLPDFLIFDEDLNKRNVIHCNNLMALGNLGLEKYDKAQEHFTKVLELEVKHLLARTHMNLLQQLV